LLVSKPKVSFSRSIDASLRNRLFSAIQAATQIDGEGRVSWSLDDIDQYIAVLRDAFDFPDELSRRECGRIVWDGIIKARKAGKLTDSSVLREFQLITDQRLRERPVKFSMWSRLSYRPSAGEPDRLFSYGDVSMRLSGKLPRYMHIPEEEMSKLQPIPTKDKVGCGFFIATTHARNEANAADKIFGATEILHAIYNLALRPWNIMGSEQRPEATLLMGPYHFLYREGKPLHHKSTWYNQNFRDEHWNPTSSESRKVIASAKSIRRALSKLEEHPLKKPLSSCLLMMNDGMEAADMSRRTLRYWTALERLFQSDDETVPYDKLIRRSTYLDDPADLARAKLNRLRRIRNSYVHMGVTDNEHHQLTQYLADHVKAHLFYLLFNGDDFANHGEFIEMVDLPSDPSSLRRRRYAIDRRERMIETRRHRHD